VQAVQVPFEKPKLGKQEVQVALLEQVEHPLGQLEHWLVFPGDVWLLGQTTQVEFTKP